MSKSISGFRQYVETLRDYLEKNDPDTKKKIDEILMEGGKRANAFMDRLEYCYHVYLFFGFHKSVECIKRHLEGREE
jgi:hypothetical protein